MILKIAQCIKNEKSSILSSPLKRKNMKRFVDLDFKKDSPSCTFLGRNGQFKCEGVALTKTLSQTIFVEPRTSKKQIGRALIEFPVSSIPEVIEFLKQFVE